MAYPGRHVELKDGAPGRITGRGVARRWHPSASSRKMSDVHRRSCRPGLLEGLPLSAAPPGPCGWDGDALIAPRNFDPDRARALLAEAGWSDADGDGIREKGGRELSFELIVHQSAEDIS